MGSRSRELDTIQGTYAVDSRESGFVWRAGRLECSEELAGWVGELVAVGDPIPAPEPSAAVIPNLSEPWAAYLTIRYAICLHSDNSKIEWPRYDDESRNVIH